MNTEIEQGETMESDSERGLIRLQNNSRGNRWDLLNVVNEITWMVAT